MSDFVQKAFKDALKRDDELEYKAFRKNVADNYAVILETVRVGMSIKGFDVNNLSEVVIKADRAMDFAAFTSALAQIVFHLGYEAGRERELENNK